MVGGARGGEGSLQHPGSAGKVITGEKDAVSPFGCPIFSSLSLQGG